MPWIRVDQSLPTHRKLMAAADALNIEPVQVMGHLMMLWMWAIDNAPSGQLFSIDKGKGGNCLGISSQMIARVCQYRGAHKRLVKVLISVGFLDVSEAGILSIHDWDSYSGKSVKDMQAGRERQRKWRERNASRNSDEAATERVTFGTTIQTVQTNSTNKDLPPVVPLTSSRGRRSAQGATRPLEPRGIEASPGKARRRGEPRALTREEQQERYYGGKAAALLKPGPAP